VDEGRLEKAVAAAAKSKGRRRRRLFDERAMGIAIVALRDGASFGAAGKAAGFSASAVYRARKRCPVFDAACAEAAKAGDVPRLVFRSGGDRSRGWRVRRGRRHLFDAARKEIYLEHFAVTLDAAAAAEKAGVCLSTPYEHRRRDPAFAAAWDEAVAIGVARIGEEQARQRLAAADAIRVRGDGPLPEDGPEFERAMAFLRYWSRRQQGGKAGGPPLTKWSFDDAMAEMERLLDRHGVPKAPEETDGTAREDGDGEEGGDAGGPAA
jgi:hypothetical protein